MRRTSAGSIPAGPAKPAQLTDSKPGSVSAIAGHWGNSGLRVGLVTPSTFIFPALMNGTAELSTEKPIGIWPPTMSLYIFAAPLYGTCSSSMPAMWLSMSPASCADVPMPLEPKEIVPGAFFAIAISEAMSSAGNAVAATSAIV